MHVSANKLSRTALAAVLAAAVALVPAGVAFAVDGDGSSAGSVSNSDSTATADKKDVSKARVDAAAADADAAKGESDNGEAPKPVDNPDNSIDDGQTSDNSFLYDRAARLRYGLDRYRIRASQRFAQDRHLWDIRYDGNHSARSGHVQSDMFSA